MPRNTAPRKQSTPQRRPAETPAPASPPQRIFAGTSGWAYPTWKPGFYPQGTSAKRFLTFYASKLNSVEVNYTFTKSVTPGQLEGWLADTPPDFRFSFKAPQRITHFKRLLDSHTLVAEFFDSLRPVVAAGKLGLILFQLPPNFKINLERLRDFLAAPAFRRGSAPPIAFEFRHPSWFTAETSAILTRHDASFCIADTDLLATPEQHTASLHTGFRLRRTGGYSAARIRAFAERFQALATQRDVFVYFRHEDEPTGALNAVAFLRRIAALQKKVRA